MKASKVLALLAMAMLFAITAYAAANKTSVEINRDVVVGGKTLSAGKYTVTWQGQGQNVDLSVNKGKQLIVKVPARLLDLPKISALDAVVIKDNADGTRALSQIQISGKKYALEIGESTQTDVASRVK
jgi:hypothetical protein